MFLDGSLCKRDFTIVNFFKKGFDSAFKFLKN